jgi:hypothetical protein
VFREASKKNVAFGVKSGYFQGPWTLAVEGDALETLRTSKPAKQPHMPDERNCQIHLCVILKTRIILMARKSTE